MKTTSILLLCIATGIPSALAESKVANLKVGKPAPLFEAVDASGKKVGLANFKGKLVVLEWTNPTCRHVRKHYVTQDMQKRQKMYTAKGVIWLTINSTPKGKPGFVTAEEANTYVMEQGASPSAYLLDTDGKVGGSYGATITPSVFLVDPKGNLMYKGAVDDVPSWEPSDVEDAMNYISIFLDAHLEKKEVEDSDTENPPFGTPIPYLQD